MEAGTSLAGALDPSTKEEDSPLSMIVEEVGLSAEVPGWTGEEASERGPPPIPPQLAKAKAARLERISRFLTFIYFLLSGDLLSAYFP